MRKIINLVLGAHICGNVIYHINGHMRTTKTQNAVVIGVEGVIGFYRGIFGSFIEPFMIYRSLYRSIKF